MAPFILHLNQKWESVGPLEDVYPIIGQNAKFQYGVRGARGRTLVTPPNTIAGKKCLIQCTSAGYFPIGGVVAGNISYGQTKTGPTSARALFQFFISLNSTQGQLYNNNSNQMLRPAVATIMNNFFYSTGAQLVDIPDGPFEMVVTLSRADNGWVGCDIASTSPHDPDIALLDAYSSLSTVFTIHPVE